MYLSRGSVGFSSQAFSRRSVTNVGSTTVPFFRSVPASSRAAGERRQRDGRRQLRFTELCRKGAFEQGEMDLHIPQAGHQVLAATIDNQAGARSLIARRLDAEDAIADNAYRAVRQHGPGRDVDNGNVADGERSLNLPADGHGDRAQAARELRIVARSEAGRATNRGVILPEEGTSLWPATATATTGTEFLVGTTGNRWNGAGTSRAACREFSASLGQISYR
jgi:hypothetical protein